MRVEILHVADCPNVHTARVRIEAALDAAGVAASIDEVEVDSADGARRLGMRGSPTILVDGRDLFAGAATASLSCRLYRVDGDIDGAPSVQQLMAALTS